MNISARQSLSLLVWLAICFSAAFLGGWFTHTGPDSWYSRLTIPDWGPPDWVFSPVWTTLYVMMALAAWLVWLRRRQEPAIEALTFFLAQLVLNATWPIVFFGWESTAAGFAVILLLWCAILATTAWFWQVRPLAGVLLLPYLAWVTYAAALNYAIWRINP